MPKFGGKGAPARPVSLIITRASSHQHDPVLGLPQAQLVRLMETYLTFCGIGINNAQLFDTYMKEYDRNRKLLEVAHDLFEEQTCLDNVVQKIMQRAQSLLKCERCSVMLVKDPSAEGEYFKVKAEKIDMASEQRNTEEEFRLAKIHTSMQRVNSLLIQPQMQLEKHFSQHLGQQKMLHLDEFPHICTTTRTFRTY